jgi:uncharacterized membrane protein
MFEFFFKYRPVVFQHGDLVFQSPVALWVLGLGWVLVAGAGAWTYTRGGRGLTRRDRIALGAIRVLAVALLVFALSRPILVIATIVPQQNFLGVLIDDSRSMGIADQDETPRNRFVYDHFGPDGSPLLSALADRFKLRFFRFSENATRLRDTGELTFAGTRTDMASALDQVRLELAAVPLAGLVVVTDGADNGDGSLSEVLLQLQADGVPVHTVGLGTERFAKDIEINRLEAPRRVLRGSAVAVDLTVKQSGFDGQTVALVVEDEGRIIKTQQVELPDRGEPATVRVHFVVEEQGSRLFTFSITPVADEVVRENNKLHTLIQVDDGRKDILYFEGEPRWEIKFLRRAIADDENVRVVVLVRAAENKFSRYGVESPDERQAGFPDTREELFRYDGLVLGSVEASFFTADQLRMIADFVAVRGGGLLTLGGRWAFAEGGYAGTPVADALPVVLDHPSQDEGRFFAEIDVRPTPFGLTHAVTQLAPTPEESADRWAELPGLSTLNLIRDVKPGATTLLTAEADGVSGDVVVLAYQRYGRGKSISFVVQDTWFWQMHADIPLEDMTHETLWRQTLRWLVDGVPDHVSVVAEADRVSPNAPMTITAEVTDSGFIHLNGAEVIATTTAPSGVTRDIPLEWTVQKDGEYRGIHRPTENGRHEIEVTARYNGQVIGRATSHIEVGDLGAEFYGAEMQRDVLKHVAAETGGHFYTPATVGTLPEDISFTESGTSMFEERDLWDMPIVFFLLASALGAEWIYRRQRGLP